MSARHPDRGEVPAQLRNLTPEQKRRRSLGNTPEKGRQARLASPWNRGPMCDTPKARATFAANFIKAQKEVRS